jgi:glyoxylase-like metal-dependent hydrolase (beta-lactamase superfamily II)
MDQLGNFEVSAPLLGSFRLDGGAMFGVVPKTIWSKRMASDADNCISLATRSLLIRNGQRTFLVDTGMGEKWNEKQRSIYAIRNTAVAELGFEPSEVSDIILTHLHFDHCGGLTRWANGKDGEVELCYPEARVWVQKANLETATHPNIREQASYVKDNVEILQRCKVEIVDGTTEICPGLFVHRSDGHTMGLQWIEVRDGNQVIAFPSDLIPTAQHLPLPFHMGYDMSAEKILAERSDFLTKAVEEGWIVVFLHDMNISAARLGRDQKGHYCVAEQVSLD